MMRWFSRLSLLWKILLSTSVALTMLFAITGQIVLNNITRTMSDSLQDEVQTSFQAYTSLWKSRAELLSSVSRLFSDMPEVRAAFSTGDQATIADTRGRSVGEGLRMQSGIFLVTDPDGKVIASLGGDTPKSLSRNVDAVQSAAKAFPAAGIRLLLQSGRAVSHLGDAGLRGFRRRAAGAASTCSSPATASMRCWPRTSSRHRQRIPLPAS